MVLKRASLLTFSLLIALILSEGLVRLSGYRPPLNDPMMYQSLSDPLRPYGLRPGYDGFYSGGRVRVDQQGNRIVDPDCLGEPLLVLGDSIAFGQGLSDEDTIASQLQRHVCGRYKVENIAVPGYSTWNEYAAFRDYQPLVKQVIVIYAPNDPTFENDHLKLRGTETADIANDPLHKSLRVLYSHVYLSNLLANALKSLKSYNHVYSINPNALVYSMDALDRLRELCIQRRAKLSIGVYRDVWWYFDPKAREYEELLTKTLREKNFTFFLIKSHIDNLKHGEVKVAFNDPHPSKKAVGFIVSDLLSSLGERQN